MQQENDPVGSAVSGEPVEFESRRGVRLVGRWHPGKGKKAVILCHGMESSKESAKAVDFANRFSGMGIGALRFDFSYVGESEGEFADLTVTGEVDDLAGAWRFVRERASGPIGLIGSSLGGAVALLFAAEEPEVAAVATIAAVARLGRIAEGLPEEDLAHWRREGIFEWEGMRLKSSFLEDVTRVDVLAAVERIRCPLFLTHGTADTVVPCGDAEDIAGHARGPAVVRMYEGADHRFLDPAHLECLVEDISAWMMDSLRGG